MITTLVIKSRFLFLYKLIPTNMKKLLITLSLLSFTIGLIAQEKLTLDYYLPQGITYNANIPKPADIIGHEVGEWHVTHDKLMFYMQTLAASSNRITIEERGTTFEGRPLLLLTITSPKNHQNIDEIQKNHLALTTMDPSFNPDGLQRFAYWANTNKSNNLNADSNDREYHEVWPGGRTNHYWFDMNRDWLPVQLPESRARIATFHKWMPNILTDHHEMGTNSTFFFQPGEPNRVHPLTPKINQELTAEIGTFHAKALDKIGSLYYSEENYDDYYYGKGSTFPDVNGGIGILFEQASSRGHIQESDNGILTFPFTVRNQFTTALSTIEAAQHMRTKILAYQQQFFKDALTDASKNKTKAIVFGDSKDAAKAWHLAEILQRHKIKFNTLANDLNSNGTLFKKETSYVIPMNQRNTRLVNAMFEKRTSFTDSLFYDISGWTFPLAFNVDYQELNSLSNSGSEISELTPLKGSIAAQTNYAYLFEWNEYYTPKALNKLLNKGIRVKVGKSPFTVEGKTYDYGSIMIPVQNQKIDSDALYKLLTEVASESQINISSVGTGHAKGIDLGSGDFETLEKQEIAMLVGNGITSYDAGEIWHLLDQRYDTKLTKLDTDYLSRVDLSRYTSIIIPNSNGGLDKSVTEKLKTWVKNGGTLIGFCSTTEWLAKNEFMDLKFKKDTLIAKNISYEQRQNFLGAQVTGGAIFEATLDRSHPINFGYKNKNLALFRDTNIFIEPNKNSYNNPIQYTNNPLLSGYISEEKFKLLKNTVPFQVQRLGSGKVIAFTDNTNFRAFWYGTNKLLMNAIYFSKLM